MSAPTTWYLTHGARALLLAMTENEREELTTHPTGLAPWYAVLRRLDRVHDAREDWLGATPPELLASMRDAEAARMADVDGQP